jgi:excisionase family DNA binding protein
MKRSSELALDALETLSIREPSEPRRLKRGGRSVPRLALSPEEAARALGIARSTFYEIVLPQLKVATVGRRRLVPTDELQRWLSERAARV